MHIKQIRASSQKKVKEEKRKKRKMKKRKKESLNRIAKHLVRYYHFGFFSIIPIRTLSVIAIFLMIDQSTELN